MKKLYAEITNVCNLRCSFCPPSARAGEFISVDRFRVLLERIAGKAELLYFHLKGEPLLHPEIGTLLDLAGEAGFAVAVTTNGTPLPRRAEELIGKTALRRLNVSLHALPEAGAANGADAAERLDEILEAVERLRAADPARASLKTVSLRLWNRSDEAETDALAAGIERRFALEPGTLSARLAGSRGVLLRSGLSVHPAERFQWPSLGGADRGERGFCRGLRDQAGILVDGTVVPCCLDGEGDIPLGNIYEATWEEIMASPRARALRDGFSERRVVESLCRTCGFRTRFD